VSGVPTLDSSGRYQAFDGEFIANVQTYNVSATAKVLTVMAAFLDTSHCAVANLGTIAGTSLGTVGYSLSVGCSIVLSQTFSAWGGCPGSWQNITGNTTGGGNLGIWVRFA
jgi:hypothetical protein